MQKIIPHLWFDKEARAAAEFYTSVFENSKINFINLIPDTPSGDAELVGFQIMDYEFMAISAGPLFKINPSISFHARCRTVAEVNQLWEKLYPGGMVMMELGEYPFSKRYGWIQDKFGVSWQVIYTEGDFQQRIMPALMFVGDVCGKAEEAIRFYTSVFPNATAEVLARYEKGEEPDQAGTVKYAQFTLEGQEFAAMDSAWPHDFGFNEGVSLIVNCKDQKEIDYFWEKLSAVPEAEQCGWIKDKFGVSWQIVPANMGELIGRNPKKTIPVMLKMKRIIIADLQQAEAAR
ncbi:MAG: VOC family protein [candidate division KSB1 bacterium]|nr:VOC family protein [candidate division KSB1 bacterium]MDZ7358839.1 VOC family protein [candidate division KSB1 bacterium]MDZ7375855.1 VOC family protein [candidate division KSB1 bacterium]MDZ7399670.1 VOC family protein [candidate division KSB1 bacterium]